MNQNWFRNSTARQNANSKTADQQQQCMQAMMEAFPKAGAEILAWLEFIKSLAKATMAMVGRA